MTGPLKNSRHEAFTRLLFEGKDATDAYREAGYNEDRGNACRLSQNPRVRARLEELQNEVAKNASVTVESLLAELEQARQRAVTVDQLGSATSAIMGKARLAGLLVNRTEIGSPGAFAECKTIEEAVQALIVSEINDHPNAQFTNEDQVKIAELLTALLDYVEYCTRRLSPELARIYARTGYDPNERRQRRLQRLAQANSSDTES